ncbi:DUF6475 domain-containing protein [Methylobacillus sp. Pita2]|uniref:DUF6475 domain-containing protein n=1 Tax=Methylobacillus sp. Pita2 TaxID=3383245 RepID=UPI0038B60F21
MSYFAQNAMIAESNVKEFGSYIQAFMQTYYRQDIGVSGSYLWFMSFKDKCTLAEFVETTTAYANESMSGRRLPQPVPGDIHLRLKGAFNSNNAWSKVLYAIKHFGSSYAINFDDAKTHGAISRMGGWVSLCQNINKRQEQDVFREFMGHYAACGDTPQAEFLVGAYGNGSPRVTLKSASKDRLQLDIQKPLVRLPSN